MEIWTNRSNTMDCIKLLFFFICLTVSRAYTPSGHEGCYRFSARALERVLSSSIYNSGDDCKDICKNAGYSYAGTRSLNCWCGNSIGSEKSEGSCDWGCPDSRGEVCGGLYGISIYDAKYNVNLVAAIVTPIVLVIVIVIIVVVVIIYIRRRRAKRDTGERYMSSYHAEPEKQRERGAASETNRGFSKSKSPTSHMKADLSLSNADEHSYGGKKRTWSQYDDDEYETDSNFTPVNMDDNSYSSYPRSPYHDTAI